MNFMNLMCKDFKSYNLHPSFFTSNCLKNNNDGLNNIKLCVKDFFNSDNVRIILLITVIICITASIIFNIVSIFKDGSDLEKRKLKFSVIFSFLAVLCIGGEIINFIYEYLQKGILIGAGLILIFLSFCILIKSHDVEDSDNSELQIVETQDKSYFEKGKYTGKTEQDASSDIIAAGWKVERQEVDSPFGRKGMVVGFDLNDKETTIILKICRGQDKPAKTKKQKNDGAALNEEDVNNMSDIGGSY